MAISYCNSTTDSQHHELLAHGSVAFPISCYDDDMANLHVPWHWHDEMEFAIITSGTCEWSLENTRYTLQAGEGIFINAGALHAVADFGHSGSTLHSAVFHPRLVGGSMDSVFWQRLIQPLVKDAGLRCLVLRPDVPWQKNAMDCFAEAWNALANEPDDYENLVRYHLSRCLGLLAANHVASPVALTGQEQLDASRIRTMLAYIEKHYSEDLSLMSIAGSANISASAALRCFNTALGITPIQYVRRLRIEKAADLLRSTVLTSTAIASECGFNDFSYFTKIFRETMGQTPRAYRLMCRASSPE